MKKQLDNLRVHMVTLCVDRDYARKEELQRKYRKHGLNKAESAEFRALVLGVDALKVVQPPVKRTSASP